MAKRTVYLGAEEDEEWYVPPSADSPEQKAPTFGPGEEFEEDDDIDWKPVVRLRTAKTREPYKRIPQPATNLPYKLDPLNPRVRKARKPRKVYENEVAPPLLSWWPETKIGPSKQNNSGLIHLTYFPIPPPTFTQTTPGWIVQALKEPNLPEARQSSMAVSHFSRMIKKPYALWLNEHLIEEGFNPNIIRQVLLYRGTNKPRKGGPQKKVPGGHRWPLRWVSSTCIGWLLHQVVNVQTLRPLQPMVHSIEHYRVLKATIDKGLTCPMRMTTDPDFMDRTEAEDLLGVRWSNSLAKLWTAYARAKAKYDFRKYSPEDEPWATDMEDKVDDAFHNLMARRFMQPPYHKIISDRYRLTYEQIKRIFHLVNILLYKRAAVYLQDERREAFALDRQMPPWNDKNIKERFLVLRQDLFNKRRIGVDAAKEAGLLEAPLSDLFVRSPVHF